MPRNPDKRLCARTGCRAWALRGGTFCRAHAGQARLPPASAEAASDALPTLESEILLLADWRRTVEELLTKRLKDPNCPPLEAVRCLTALAQVGKSMAQMIAQRARTSGDDDVLRFLEEVELHVREMEAGNEGMGQPASTDGPEL